MGLLYGRAGRLTAKNGGFRPGQSHKLTDALQLLQQRARPIDLALPALDVGSAPGGWSEALLAHGCARVVAIDPAEMDAALMGASVGIAMGAVESFRRPLLYFISEYPYKI